MECENVTLDYEEKCRNKLDCRLVRCGTMYEPVCG